MKTARLKQIIEAAAKLPPAKGRALLGAVAAKAAPERGSEDYLAQAADAMAAAMEEAMAAELEAWAERQFPK